MPPLALDESEIAGLLEVGRANGLDALGIAAASTLDRARAALFERRRRGLHAGMAFTYRNPERSTEPSAAVAGARSIIVGARRYLCDEPERPIDPSARIARYAWIDHYAPLRTGLWAMAHELRRAGWKAVAFADDNSIVDREVAWRAGIGWFGKNANLLLPHAGSWFVLGCVITDAPLPVAAMPVADGCGTCHRCIDACPTGAIIESGVIDSNRCLAWLLQKPGVFPREYRVALGDRLYGCDDCQEVCPPNVRFAASRGELGPLAEAWVSIAELLESDDDTLLARHARFYIAGRDPRWLRRNALIVLGNIGDGGDRRTGALLEHHLGHPDPILRAHAVWAAARLARIDLLPAADPDPMVDAELNHLPEPRPASR
ncbi:MAG TPA: tRNA epoxyqueuosine(34) reductase QueG [Ilumatobacteraceae bacterium]